MTTTLTNTGWTGDSTGMWTEGADSVNGTGGLSGIFVASGTVAKTLGGDDSMTGIGEFGILNYGTIDTGNGNDSMTGGGFFCIENLGTIDMGSGNDSITGSGFIGIENYGTIDTGNGNDSITGSGYIGINNLGPINTGNGNDSITGSGTFCGIYSNNIINTGAGNDTLIANGGFDGGGQVLLGSGDDYLKGFGSGRFDGGRGQDTMELTTGAYTVGISGATVTFTQGGTVMTTTGFEHLIVGSTTFNFTTLSNGQIIGSTPA